MKKQILPLLLTLGIVPFSVAQQVGTYVVGNAKVKVEENTLFYHGGGFNITSQVTLPEIVDNSGNIKILNGFTNEAAAEEAAFTNRWISEDKYGQVIIDDAVVVAPAHKMIMQKNPIDPDTFSWGQFSFPFKFDNAGDAVYEMMGIDYVNSGNRYRHSLMRWNNILKPQFDQLKSDTPIAPGDYMLLNLQANAPGLIVLMNSTPLFDYKGSPTNGVYPISFNLASYSDQDWDTWKNETNSYNEKYVTYIDDPLRNGSLNVDYGRYVFQFGNPYTSNIDLSYIGLDNSAPVDDGVYIEDLQGVTKYTGVEWTKSDGLNVAAVVAQTATFNGSTWAGNRNALIIKPFEAFTITLKGTVTDRNTRVFNFNDGLKVFSNLPNNNLTTTVNPTPSTQGKSTHGSTFADLISPTVYETSVSNNFGLSSSRLPFYQLELDVYSETDEPTGNSVYIVVDNMTVNGSLSPLESEYLGFTNGLFALQENLNGDEILAVNATKQINAISHSFIGKPIPLAMKFDPNDYSGYFVKANLFYKDIFSKLSTEEVNYADGNSFFFYDKVQDVLLPITTDFSYYLERSEENIDLRYVIYWNGGPETNSDRHNVEEVAQTTIIYKDLDLHKIRFNKTWKFASVKVYDLTGRLVFTESVVDVSNGDYTLDLPKVATYVVKVESENGEIYTQKIIK